jgi:DNA-binding LacI/PurR family transcriptional regulator
MSEFRSLTTAEQIAAHLRTEVIGGERRGLMPGVLRLEAELGVNRKTVETALRQLEAEGLLLPQGAGRRRLIQMPEHLVSPVLRVAILPSEEADRRLDYLVELQHELTAAGHCVFYLPDSMVALGMDVKRIARMVEKTEADAWLAVGGSREILEWFAAREAPVFALFGRRRGLRIASVGPNKPPAMAEATRMLISLGHRRIVLLARPRRRLPQPGTAEQAFLDALAAHGIAPGPYHLPDWGETIEGFYGRLDSLYRLTPPTALIIDEAPLFVATQQFLAGRRLRVPEDVSLVCTDADPAFEWCRPAITHIRWDSGPVVRRILRWAENVSRGKKDLRQTLTPAELVRGGTIGPAKG